MYTKPDVPATQVLNARRRNRLPRLCRRARSRRSAFHPKVRRSAAPTLHRTVPCFRRRPRSFVLTTRMQFGRPAAQEFLRRNSSLRPTAHSQRWRLPTDHWQLPAGACPPGPRPAHRPLARSPQPACHPPVRRPAVRTPPQPLPFAIRNAMRCSHYSYEAWEAHKSKPPERQLRASPACRRRPSRPSIPAAHDPAEHRSARGAPRPHPHSTPHPKARPNASRTPSQSAPRTISTANLIVLITRTNDWRPVSRGLSEHAPHFTALPLPRPGNPPLVPGDCPPDLRPVDAPRARRSQVACATPMRQPGDTASADPRSQVRTTPTKTGRPAAPRARTHTPAPRLTPQPDPKPPVVRPCPPKRTSLVILSYSLLVRSVGMSRIRSSQKKSLISSPRPLPAPATRSWRLPTADRLTPSTPSPRPKPPAFPVGDPQCSTRRTHYFYEARAAHKSKPPERQLRASPARRSRPRRPSIPAAHDPDEHRSARGVPRSQVRTTPTNTGRPAASLDLSCARPRRTPVGPRRRAPTPPRHASRHSPTQSPPHAVPPLPPNDQAR